MASYRQSQIGLDWLNFFVANVQAGFGPFIVVYLTGERWTETDIGLVLSIGTIAGMASQVPAGALVDRIGDKRWATLGGLVGILAAALLTAISPAQLSIAVAQLVHGFASSLVSPSIASLSLALVGIAGMGERIGRNARFASLGNGIAAALMGAAASLVSDRAVFLLAAIFTAPALLALRLIPRAQIPMPERRAAGPAGERSGRISWGLVVFAAACFLFQLANAAQLPLAGIEVTKEAGNWAGALIAACVVVPQLVVAALSPAVGEAAERIGRRKLLVFGFMALPARALLFAVLPNAWLVVPVQALDGASAAVMGVLLPLVAADLTRGGGRFNLVQGTLGLTGGLGATFSTSIAGIMADRGGAALAFVGLAIVGLAAVVLLALAMPETKFAGASGAGGGDPASAAAH